MSDPLLEPARLPRSEQAAIYDQDDTADAERVDEQDAERVDEQGIEREPAPNVPLRPGRHSGWQRAILVLNIVIVIACFAGAVGLIVAKRVRESVAAAPEASVVDADGVPVNADGVFVGDPTATFPAADPEAKNFLVVGDDSHACVDPNSPWAGAADPERTDIGQRSDTIMLVRIDPASKRAAILSFPRDLWVKVPGHGRARINSAYRKGDYSLLAQTIYDNFGAKVDHYVQVDFCAFKTIVDAVGGVAVPFEYAAKDDHVNLHIDAPGCHTFSGDEALAYVRSRYYEYQDTDGKWKLDNAYDLGRISRQQDFARRLFETALGKGVFNASVAKSLIDTLTKYVVVDQPLSIDGMLQFLGVLREVQPQGIPTFQIATKRQIIQNNDVLVPQTDSSEMTDILDLFRGKTSLQAAPTTTSTTAAPTDGLQQAAAPATTIAGAAGEADAAPPAATPEQETMGIVPPAGLSC
jgi:LCP family protein required for cell wall assembly